jgi:hypothetical protein
LEDESSAIAVIGGAGLCVSNVVECSAAAILGWQAPPTSSGCKTLGLDEVIDFRSSEEKSADESGRANAFNWWHSWYWKAA